MTAASSSKATSSRTPENIPLPPSPPRSNQEAKPKRTKKSKRKDQVEAEAVKDTTGAWSWTSLTDSSASKLPPIFTKDGSHFFSIVGSSVKIYSVATGQVVSTLSSPTPPSPERDGRSNLITSATLNPHNAFQLITVSLDGCIKIWDFLDAVLLQTIDIAQPILHVCAHENFKNTVFVAATRPSKKKSSKGKDIEDNAVVLSVSLKPTADTASLPVQKSSRISAVGKTRSTTALAISPNGSWIVAIAGHKAYVARTASLKSGFTKYVSPERLTCLAFHPSDEYFATGDSEGHIRLWHCLNDQVATEAVGVEKRTQTTTLHWHAHAVSSIAFTPNGAYLLSGGEESVLVIWQLHSGKKEFIPRVGAPINTVVVSKTEGAVEEEYLLGLADASFVFVNAGSLKISRAYSRIKLDPASSHVSPSGTAPVPLAVHSTSSTLLLPSSHASSLQTYSPSTSKLIAELEVSPSNRVSRRDEKPVEPSRVERAVIAPSGEWMATVDSREGDESFRAEIYLKIWRWDTKSGFWALNTRIDRPHGLKKVTAVAFSSGSNETLQLVTTGEDRIIKTWRIRTAKEKSGSTEDYWVARSTFGFRSEIPTHASWSPDGSLLAISLGPYVALYNPLSNQLIQALTSPECKSVSSAYFVGPGGRYLAAVGNKDLVLWDLVTRSIRWHHKATSKIDIVIPHPHDETFALFHHDDTPSSSPRSTRISLFTPSSPTPHATHTLPFALLNLAWYRPSPSPSPSTTSYTLVGITHTWSVVLFGDEPLAPDDEGASARSLSSAADGPGSEKRTLFQDIFGKAAFADRSNAPSSTTAAAHKSKSKDAAGIFDAPAYLMPPLETLFDPLMKGFLKPRAADEARDADDEDVAMEVEVEEPLVLGGQHRRVVDAAEIGALTELFRAHAIKPGNRPSEPLRTPVPVQKLKAAPPSSRVTPKPAAHTPRPQREVPPASSPPLTNGSSKKRKKSTV